MLQYLPLVLIAVVYFLYYYFTRTFNYWKDRNVPGPAPVPFFGNLKESTLRRKNIGVVFKEIYENYPNEKVVGVFRMTTPALLLRDLDIIKHIMIKDFDSFVDRGVEFSDDGLGLNLFHADAETWRILRSKFTPIFTSGKLKNMLYLMTERGDQFIEHINSVVAEQTELEVRRLVQMYTMTSIVACAFGLDIGMDSKEIETLKKIDRVLLDTNLVLELDMMYPGILKKLNSTLFPAFITNFFLDLVRNIIQQRNGQPTNRKDFMDLIIELKQQKEVYGNRKEENGEQKSLQLTDDIIAAQAFVFFAGGYETSATTMTCMLYELAKHPDVQEKLIAEIDEVLERHGGNITYECLNEMTYLDQTFSETLRKYPIVEPLQRNAQVDYKIPDTDITVEKGTTVLISPYGIHHDEKYYKNPLEFDPERWSADNSRDRHPCAYMPFGVGPRNCIGMRFGKFQSRVCIAKLLSSFRVECTKNTVDQIQQNPKKIIMGPKDGIYLNFVRRVSL